MILEQVTTPKAIYQIQPLCVFKMTTNQIKVLLLEELTKAQLNSISN